MGQAITFAFSPLITRIYSPEIFGLQGVFLSLVSILSPAFGLRYPMAIIVAKDETEAQKISRLALLIACVMSCLLSLILLFARDPVLKLMGVEPLGLLIWFLPLALFCATLQDVTDYRTARFGLFRLVGIVTVVQSFLTNGARVLGGLVAPVAGILITLTSVGPAIQAGMLTFGSRKRRPAAAKLSFAEAKRLLMVHKDFPLYRMPTDVMNSASQSVPVILLASLYSPAAAGLYALTRSVLNLPSNIIGNAIGNVLYTRFAEVDRKGQRVTPLLLRATGALMALAPLIIGFAWFAPSVFAFIFGEEWREAGNYARWMSLWVGISIANVPAIRLAPVIKAQKLLLVANIIILLARTLTILMVFWAGGVAHTVVAAFSLVSVVANGGLIVLIMISARIYERKNVGKVYG